MRFLKGSKVEVIANTKELCVEWRCARIISGNGHTYSVRYDGSNMTNEAGVERVPRKAIRPCPPLIEGIERWAANDVLEVYDDGSWTAGKVLKFIGRDLYLVMLFVSCKELEVHKVNMRVRQSWQNGEWVVKPKVPGNSGNFEGGKCYRNSISNGYKVMPEVHHVSTESQQGSHDLLPGLDGSGLLEPRLASSTTLKRVSPYGSSPVEAYPRKIRVVMNKGPPCQDGDALSSDAESLDITRDRGCLNSPREVIAERIHRASVGGLPALLPMAKLDARALPIYTFIMARLGLLI